MSPISEQLKQIRAKRKLTQAELGTKLGLPQSHVSKIERGDTDPRLSTIVEIARVLDHDLVLVPRQLLPAFRALLGGEEESTPLWTLDDEGADQ